jgi:hypothetical protein
MEAIIVNLESTYGTESPYVMLSRAKSLDGIFILRPFRRKVTQCHPNQDVRAEFKRLDMLAHQTIMHHGSADEAAAAQAYLVKNFSAAALPSQEGSGNHDELSQDCQQLQRLQNATTRLMEAVALAQPTQNRQIRNRRVDLALSIPEQGTTDINSSDSASPTLRKRTLLDDSASGRWVRNKRG